MKRRILRGLLSIFSAEVGTQLLGLIITPILVRLLTTDQYGNYVFVIAVYSISMMFVRSGLLKGIRKYIAEDREIEDWHDHVFGFFFRLAILSAAVGVGLTLLGVAVLPIGRYLGEEFRRYFLIFAGLLVTSQLFYAARSGLMGIGLEHLVEPLRILHKVVFGAVGLSLAALSYGVAGVLFGNLAANAIAAVLALAILARRVSLSNVFKPTPPDFPRRELLSFNAFTLVLSLLFVTLYQVDIVLLRVLVGSEPAGYYKIALTVAEFIWLVPLAIETVLLHSTSALWSQKRFDHITAVSTLATRYTLLLSALLAVGVAALADTFIPIYYGSKYEPAVLPLLLLLPGTLGFAVSRPLVSIGEGQGALKILIVATGTSAVLNVVLNLILIPLYGSAGAAVATSIGYGSMLVFHLWSARKIGFDPLTDLRPFRILSTILIAGSAIAVVSRLITSDLLALFVVPPVGFVIYALTALGTGAVDTDELEDIVRNSPLPVSRISSRM